MSAVLSEILVEAIEDEYKARASYRAVIQQFGDVRPFINIVEAEGRHIEALLPLFDKYSITVPEDDWPSRVTCPESLTDACKMGVAAEIENAEMYHRLIAAAENYPDVQAVCCASYNGRLRKIIYPHSSVACPDRTILQPGVVGDTGVAVLKQYS